jgi:hypothetical protein
MKGFNNWILAVTAAIAISGFSKTAHSQATGDTWQGVISGVPQLVVPVPDVGGAIGANGYDTGWKTNVANGNGVALMDPKIQGGGVSDYIYAFAGTIWFVSDNESTPSRPPNLGANPTLEKIIETGGDQTSTTFGKDFIFTSDVCEAKGQSRIGGAMVCSVPEPATWSMLIAGLGLTGLSLRWRRRRITVSVH